MSAPASPAPSPEPPPRARRAPRTLLPGTAGPEPVGGWRGLYERLENGMLWLCLGVTLAFGALGALQLAELRRDSWARVERNAANLLTLIERDIRRNVEVYDLSMQAVAEGVELLEGIDLPQDLRRRILFDRATEARHFGSIMVLDAEGQVVEQSDPRAGRRRDLAGRDFFLAHLVDPGLGLHIGAAFTDPVEGDLRLSLSRRLTGPDGRFKGVVVGTLRLDYFVDLLSDVGLGQGSTINLISRRSGVVLYRAPARPGDIGRSLLGTPNFERSLQEPPVPFIGRAAIDGVTRFYTYSRVGTLPLIVNVAVSVDSALESWQRRAWIIGGIMAGLSLLMLLVCLGLRRALQLRRRAEQHALQQEALYRALAQTDALTGLANRRQFDTVLQSEWRRMLRQMAPLTLLLIDTDHFKAFNDRYGHPAGDAALQMIAARIAASIHRTGDLAARYGGEEFAVLLPATDQEGGMALAEALRQDIAAQGKPHAGNPPGVVTVSIGVATARPQLGKGATVLLDRADAALYAAKAAGRNRVEGAG